MIRFIHTAATAYWRDENLHPFEGWRLLRECGFDTVRLVIDSSQVITGPYKYDFGMRLDLDVELFAKLGFKFLINPLWAPAHMSDGQPAYGEFVRGCSVFDKSDPSGIRFANRCGWLEGGVQREATHEVVAGACGAGQDHARHIVIDGTPIGPMNHPFTPEKPYCVLPNVPHLDKEQMFDWGRALAQHFVELAKRFNFNVNDLLWSFWNEIGGPQFWPPVQSPPYEDAYDRFVLEAWIPFVRGVRSVLPRAVFVGPDADFPGTLHFFLDAVKRADARYLPNEVSGHLYAQGGEPFPLGTINELTREGGWFDVMRRHGYTKLWNTEYAQGRGYEGREHDSVFVDGTRELIRRFGNRVVAHCSQETGALFRGGQAAWNAGRFEPNDAWYAMKKLIRDTNRKRRTARS